MKKAVGAAALASLVLSGSAGPRLWVRSDYRMDDEKGWLATSNLVVRAARAGYREMLVGAQLENAVNVNRRALENYRRLKQVADRNGMGLIPAVFGLGCPSLPCYVDPENTEATALKGLAYVADGARAVFAPRAVSADLSAFGRRSLAVALRPYTRYRLSFALKTENLLPDIYHKFRISMWYPKSKNSQLYDPPMKPTQDWTDVSFMFDTYESGEVRITGYKARQCTGSFSVKDVRLEELAPHGMFTSDGMAPVVRDAASGIVYEPGRDYRPVAKMKHFLPRKGDAPFAFELLPGGRIASGTQLLVDCWVPGVVCNRQVSACPSAEGIFAHEAKSARAIQELLQPKTWLLGIDEWRIANRCLRCQSRGVSPGELMGRSFRRQYDIVRAINPKAEIAAWADMFAPTDNAHPGYYVVNGDIAGSWNYAPKDVLMVVWENGHGPVALSHFEKLGFRTLSGAYYDHATLDNDRKWLAASTKTAGCEGMMYTTWCQRYGLLEDFAALVKGGNWSRPAGAGTPLPESFRKTKPEAVFSKASEKYAYLPFAKGPVEWGAADAKVATGCPEFSIDRPRPHGGGVVKATDFGFSPAHSNNAACVTRAIAYAKEIGADRVELAPGVYRCHDREGVRVFGTRDLVIDGKGACLVFYRPSVARSVTYWEVEISTDYGSFRVFDNERLEIRDLRVDWDWEIDPLAERARLVDVHFDAEEGKSYWEFAFVDYARHPVWPRHLPIQTLAELSEGEPVRFADSGACRYFGTQEGHHGMKMEWQSPNRARFYPGVRPTAAGTYVHPDCERHFTEGSNGRLMKAIPLVKGRLYRLCHYYVGKNCFDLKSNHHLTLENVKVHSCRGDAFHVEGDQHHWQLLDVAVWPPEDPAKAGGGPRTRPMTTTLDVMHIGCSKGWSKLVGFRCTMNQDDHANFHDRFSAVRKTGAREARITQGRGNAYFRAEVGDELEFRNADMTPAGFSARVAAVVNDTYLRFDRDLPDRFAAADAFVFNRVRGTDNILVRDCLYDSCWGRFLMLGHNVTFENCTWRNCIASAVLVQEGLNYGYWAEGFGSGNVVIRNCRFERLQKFNRASFAGVVQDLFIGANLMDHGKELTVPPEPSIISKVLVEGCTFANPRGAVWHARNGENLVFRNNTIDLTEDDPLGQPYRGSVFVEGTTRQVRVSGNRLVGAGEAGLICER